MINKVEFEVCPAPIHPRDIKEEVITDVVVVGAGIAGLTAALSTVETGTRTVLIEKGSTIHYRGGQNAAIASKMQKQAGVTIDKEQIIIAVQDK
jgi:fumarate reductase flavoprotein subunit